MKSVLPTLAENTPVDKTAARVIMPGFYEEMKVPAGLHHFKTCPPLREFTNNQIQDPNFKDYTGAIYGRFKVIGAWEDFPKSYRRTAIVKNDGTFNIKHESRANHGNCRWVVRCACGCYEIRSTKAVRKADSMDRCFICMRTIHTLRTRFFMENGRKPTREELQVYL